MEGNYKKWINRINSKQDVLTDDNVGQFMDLELPTKLTPTSGDTVLARDSVTGKAVKIPTDQFGGGGSGGDTSNLVPYTGANKDVNIGAYNFETSQGFKKTGGTGNQALTANGDTFDLDSKENVANKATDLSIPDNTKYPTTLAVVNETKKATITVELISQLTTNFYAPNSLRINSTALISGSGTLTLKVNDVAYTLGNLIPQGAKITAETTSSSVYNLISIYE